MIAMADALGLVVIAEGVENAAQADGLLALGCPHAQGYHHYRPLRAEDFDAVLAASHAVDADFGTPR